MGVDLKRCPWCHRPAELDKYDDPDAVRCSDNSGWCPASQTFISRERWNRRPDEALAQRVEVLEGLLRKSMGSILNYAHSRRAEGAGGHAELLEGLADAITAALPQPGGEGGSL